MNSFLIEINKLLYPYILGYWSENEVGGLVVTNHNCTQMRGIGSRKWTAFVEAPINFYTTHLKPAIKNQVNEVVLASFLKEEGIEDQILATKIVDFCKPFFLARLGDLQALYHYCLVKNDPMETGIRQKVAFLFPGTQMDLTDTLPETDKAWASPMVGGSLGWLSQLTPFDKTIASIKAAKKRLE